MILQIHIGIGRYVNMITCLKGCQPELKNGGAMVQNGVGQRNLGKKFVNQT